MANPLQVPPQSLEMEQAVIGCLLIAPERTPEALEIVSAMGFYRDVHRLLFRTIVNLHEQGIPADLLTVDEALGEEKPYTSAGGREYLLKLINAVPTAVHLPHYARHVADMAVRRRLIQTCSEIEAQAYDTECELTALLEDGERRIYTLTHLATAEGLLPLKETMASEWAKLLERQQNPDELTGVPTGLADLNQITQGLQKGDSIVLGARPSIGKSALAFQMAVSAADVTRQPVAIFSLEMSREQVATRMMVSESRVEMRRIVRGLDEGATRDVTRALGALSALPLYVDDAAELTPRVIRAKLRRMARDGDPALVVIDYLQLLRPDEKAENQHQSIAQVSRAIKAMAREFHVPILTLSQLSRNVERRDQKRPMLSDLRESGAVEADADLVLLLHRPGHYDNKGPTSPDGSDVDETELIVAKHRNGPVGTLKLVFNRRIARFEAAARPWEIGQEA